MPFQGNCKGPDRCLGFSLTFLNRQFRSLEVYTLWNLETPKPPPGPWIRGVVRCLPWTVSYIFLWPKHVLVGTDSLYISVQIRTKDVR